MQGIGQAMPAIRDRAVIEAKQTVVQVIAQLLRNLMEGIATLDRKIAEAAEVHPDYFIFQSLPGAGAALAPRLLAALGSQRDRYGSAAEVQKYSGIAPVTEKRGRRNGCTSGARVPNSCGRVFTNGRNTRSRSRFGRVSTTSDSASAARNTMPR